MITRDVICAEALSWRGTPYVHAASLKGIGTDCLGLVRGIWRHLYGSEPQTIPAYSATWDAHGGGDLLVAALKRHFQPRPVTAAQIGDVLAFRMVPGAGVGHVAILTGQHDTRLRMLHAYWGRAAVESWVGPWWRQRWVAAFSFPDVE